MTSSSRIAVYLVGALLWGLCPRLGLAEDYEFYHENVMGTSLELRVRAMNENGRQTGRGSRAPRDRSTERDLQRLRRG